VRLFRCEDPKRFQDRVLPLLLRDEVGNNLMIGTLSRPVEDPPAYSAGLAAPPLRCTVEEETQALSQRLLESGRKWCALFTDLANPTSNSIYQRIGYRPVCDFQEYRFAP
jgi:hypothetical protein